MVKATSYDKEHIFRKGNKELSISLNEGMIENPVIERGLSEIILTDSTLSLRDTGFKHGYKSYKEAYRRTNKKDRIVKVVYYDKSKKMLTMTENGQPVGIVSVSKRNFKFRFPKLIRQKKETVEKSIVESMENDIRLFNEWFFKKPYNVKFSENGEVKMTLLVYVGEGENVYQTVNEKVKLTEFSDLLF